jgi:hypothetical protein
LTHGSGDPPSRPVPRCTPGGSICYLGGILPLPSQIPAFTLAYLTLAAAAIFTAAAGIRSGQLVPIGDKLALCREGPDPPTGIWWAPSRAVYCFRSLAMSPKAAALGKSDRTLDTYLGATDK